MFNDIYEYNDLLEKIDKCLEWYENREISDIRYKLFLASDKIIQICFPENCIPHLLGINIDYLRSTGHFNGSPYTILNDILNNPMRLYNLMKSGFLSKEQIFSKHIEKKLSSFKSNCSVSIKNIEFIAEYNSVNSYTTGEEKLDGDYYIASKSHDNSLTIIGFKENKGLYYPMTNIELDDNSNEKDKFLNRLLKNQSITLIQSLIKSYYSGYELKKDKFFYNNDDKLRKLNILTNYSSDYDSHVTTNKETLFYLTKTINLYDEKNKIWFVLDEITKAILNKDIINIEELEEKYGIIKRSLFETISAYNDSIINSSDNTEFSYHEFSTELKKAKNEALKYEELYCSVNQKNEELLQKVKELTLENEMLKDNEDKIRKILAI